MIHVPAPMPLTMPEELPTVAMPGQAALHEPNGVELPSVVVVPAHKDVVPVIAAGTGWTVIVVVVLQPDGSE